MRGWISPAWAFASVAACACPRAGEAPPSTPGADTQDAPEAPVDAAPADADVPPPPPPPLPDGFRPVPQTGHSGPVWAVPLEHGQVLGLDAAGFAKWWEWNLAGVLRSERVDVPGISAVGFGGPPGARVAGLGTASGRVLVWKVPAGGGYCPQPCPEPRRNYRSVPPPAVAVDAPRLLDDDLRRAVSAVAVSAAGDRVAIGTVGGEVRLYAADGGRLWARDGDHDERITSLAFSPDGRRLAGACSDGLVSLWHAGSGALQESLPHDGPALAVAFSPDGALLATGIATRAVLLWSGTPFATVGRREGFAAEVAHLAFTPTPGALYAADRDGVVWALAVPSLDGGPIADPHFPPDFPEREGEVASFACDDVNVLVVGGADGRIRSLSPAEGAREISPPSLPVPLAVAASPAGDVVAVGSSDGAVVWLGAADGRELRRSRAAADAVTAVAFVGPDTLVAASLDGALRVWRGSSVEPAQTLSDHRGPVTSLAASPREDLVATGGADGAILLWDVADGALRYRATLSRHVSAVLSLAFTADASFLWSASLDRTAEKWTLARLRAVWHVPPDLGVVPTRIVALSTSRALAGTAEGDFRRLGPDRGAVRLRPHAGGPVSALGPAPDAAGAFLVAAGDGALRSLDPDALGGAGEWRGEALRPGEDGVEAFAAAPDGGRLFLCGAGVSAVRPGDATVLWRTFLSPRGSATFAGDGRFFATGDGGMLVAYGDGAEVRGIDDPAVRNMGEWASTSTSTSTAAATNGEGADPGATTTTGTGTATATATGVNGSGGSGAMGGEE